MLDNQGILHFSATDLAGHLSCNHLTQLDAEAARGARAKPKSWDPLLEILRKRGDLHEQAYLEHLEVTGYEIVRIEGAGLEEKLAEETVAAMGSGAAIISQAVLLDGRWGGRADILRRIDTPSALGDWSYEVIDTKLARETKGGSVLQLHHSFFSNARAQAAPRPHLPLHYPRPLGSPQFRGSLRGVREGAPGRDWRHGGTVRSARSRLYAVPVRDPRGGEMVRDSVATGRVPHMTAPTLAVTARHGCLPPSSLRFIGVDRQ